MKKEHLTSLLWIEFKEIIEASWASDYQRQFGDMLPLHEMEQPFNFARAVHKKAEQRFAHQKVAVVLVSVDTINNALQKDGISVNSKNKSLNYFAAFAGYKNWKEFELTTRHRLKQEAPPTPPPATAPVMPEVTSPPPAIETNRKEWRKYALLVLLPALVYFLYFQYQRRQIIQLIYEVNAAEFATIVAIPVVDTAYFDLFLTADANSRLIIRNVILNSMKKGKVLKKGSSFSDVNNITVSRIWWETAKVTTKEQWDLRWYDATTGAFLMKYDKVNVQGYNLKYNDGRWKVDSNVYEGRQTVEE